jgi:hypothetical protein
VHAAGAARTKTPTAGMTRRVIRIRPPYAKARIIHNLIGARVPSIETLERERCTIAGTTSIGASRRQWARNSPTIATTFGAPRVDTPAVTQDNAANPTLLV